MKKWNKLAALSAFLFLLCAGYVINSFWSQYVGGGNADQQTLPPAIGINSVGLSSNEPSDIPVYFSLLYEQNPDFVGWLSIEGTPIDYPVMFTPDDEDFYLDKNFDRQPDKNGSLILQKDCDPVTPSTVLIIHGHNMRNGRMFAPLMNYREKAYYLKHPVIIFDTLYQQNEYEIMAVFLSQIYYKNDNVFKYYRFPQIETQEEFDYFIANIKELALYDTGVEGVFGDTFVILSTCSYHTENGRLVVVARRKSA